MALFSLPSTFLHCVCAPPQPAFIFRAAPLNCPHCSDLNVCAGLAEPVPPLFHPFYPPDLSVLLLAGFGLLIKRGRLRPSTPGPAGSSLGSGVWLKRDLADSNPLHCKMWLSTASLCETLHTNFSPLSWLIFETASAYRKKFTLIKGLNCSGNVEPFKVVH